MLPIGLCAQLACIWEATARKPGNVHRHRDFEDCTYVDFLASAAAIAPVLEKAIGQRVGQTILDAVRATRQVVRSNTNLGIILLLAPLASVPRNDDLAKGVRRILDALDLQDARLAYQAIRLAAPGGLGKVAEEDVAGEPTCDLLKAMVMAAPRDLVAREYDNGFTETLTYGLDILPDVLSKSSSLETAVVRCHLDFLVSAPDSLIARKRGQTEAAEAQRRAELVLQHGWPEKAEGWVSLELLDRWMDVEGHARNPGATADLVTASLFVALRENKIPLPLTTHWSAGWNHG